MVHPKILTRTSHTFHHHAREIPTTRREKREKPGLNIRGLGKFGGDVGILCQSVRP